MNMITVAQMRSLERLAHTKGIFAKDLMENAGREVVRVMRQQYVLDGRQVIIFSGPGNNGGDGLAAARYFKGYCPVVVLFFGREEKLSEEACENYMRIKDHIPVVQIDENQNLELFHLQPHLQYILVDALTGTGLQGPLRDILRQAVEYYNSLSGIKVSIDVPSGMDADSGNDSGLHCQADLIITFHDVKIGLEKFREKTVVVDIGIPV